MNRHLWNKLIFESQNLLPIAEPHDGARDADRRENSILTHFCKVSGRDDVNLSYCLLENQRLCSFYPCFFRICLPEYKKHLNLGLFAKLQSKEYSIKENEMIVSNTSGIYFTGCTFEKLW